MTGLGMRQHTYSGARLAWAALAASIALFVPQTALPGAKPAKGGIPDYWASKAYESELQEYWFYVRQRNEAAYDVSVALELSPCRCDIWRIAKGMGWMARMRHSLDDQLRRILDRIREKYPPLIRRLARTAYELRAQGRREVVKELLGVLEAAAFDAFDKATEFGTAANEAGALRKSAEVFAARSRKAAEKAREALTTIGDVAQELAKDGKSSGGGLPYDDLWEIANLYESLAAWADLARSITDTERRLWKDILASKPCRELLGGPVEDVPKLGALLSQRTNTAKFIAQAEAAVDATCQIGRTATAGGKHGGCELRSALAALRKLYLMYEATRRHEGKILRYAAALQKGIASQYRTIVSMYARADEGTDWFKFWTGLEGWSGWIEILLSLVPAGGTATAAAHSVGTSVTYGRYEQVFRDIEREINKAQGWLKKANRQIEALGKIRDRLRRCERALWDRLRECSAKVPCEEPGKDAVAVPREGGVRVAGDSGKWCSYWGWKRRVPVPEGGMVVPREEPREKDKGRPRPDGEGTSDFPERPSVTVERPRKPKKRPQPEGEPQPERPSIYVKAKRAAVETGAKAQAVAGFQLKLLAPAPPLPLAGNRRDDRGYDEPPLQATTGRDGTAVLPGTRGGGDERSARPAPRRFALSFGDLIAEANAAEHDAPARPVTVEFEVPEFESYVVKIRVDRSRPGWDHPASYLDPPFDGYVVRHWIVGEVMYAVVNVPIVADSPGEARK